MFPASFSAAGIFFCFLVKEKAPDLIGETDVEAQRSPKEKTYIKKINKYTKIIWFYHN